MSKGLVVAAVMLLAAADSTSAAAAWGCGAKSTNGLTSHNSNEPSEAAARRDALKDCAKVGGRGCRIISCEPDVDTIERARALWPIAGKPRLQCGPAFGTKC